MTLDGGRATTAPPVSDAVRVRKSQRLRALATVLALTAVTLLISAVGLAAAVFRADGSDARAVRSLQTALRTAEDLRKDAADFSTITPAVLNARLVSVTVVGAGITSADDRHVAMAISSDGSGWYGAVRSRSGRCLAAGSVNGGPKELTAVLPGNCTGDAARAALMPLPKSVPEPPTMGPVTPAPSGAQATAG